MNTFLLENTKYLVHMRQRMGRDNRLGLCLGAGISVDFDIPTWKELVQRIASHPQVKGEELLLASESLTSQSQYLYQKLLQSQLREDTEDEVAASRKFNTEWLKILHECLYRDARTSETALKSHPYLWNLMPLIKKSSMTINYNFDDTIERMLYLHNAEYHSHDDDKGFEVTWQPTLQFRRDNGAIYHPNGFLPLEMIEGFSEQLIFVEQDFADQLIDVSHGHYSALLSHFSKNTMIFIGLSLNDSNLKHILRVSARSNPGNFHYHIQWCRSEKPSDSEQEAIRKANFSIYNLVTLFLTADEIVHLANLLKANPEEFESICDAVKDGVSTNFRYYVSGPVGSGKSTALGHIRSLVTYDEWVDRRSPLLGKPHVELTDTERTSVDEWINQQFRKKNRKISSESPGIAVIDRSPLDPLYFTNDSVSAKKRAQELLQAMAPSQSTISSIADGHLILLKCDPRVLKLRLAAREKNYNEDQLSEHSSVVSEAWNNFTITVIDTTNLSVYQVVSKVLETILFGPYQPINFQRTCEEKARES
ncbi:SIR2 family protein [Pseudohongiella sp.]|uniref:Uncharacterized protein n=1 Tax=marine sediment metagenome TaxID=412755 RepID=A0A0F9WGK7_9ZZZZ|nr:SIR2 family protein [Pseudohongiella sp.]HDZ09177.1 hypothetical protein [Pseudohongiella sp.]